MDEMSQNIIDLLLALLQGEDSANYFYQAARVWARTVGYRGAEEKFKHLSEKHAHHAKCLQNIFADWKGKIVWPGIKPPSTYFLLLPDVITDAAKVENDLVAAYEGAAKGTTDVSLGIADDVNKLRQRTTEIALHLNELVTKLALFGSKNGLDMVIYDEKFLCLPMKKMEHKLAEEFGKQ